MKPYPNPIGFGQSMQVSRGGKMFNMAGSVVKHWNQSGFILFDQLPGQYIIQWDAKPGEKTTLSKVVGFK
jgi:hypothetical protein